MSTYPVHTLETAPAKSRPALEALKAGLGFIPNVAGIMATSPVLVNSFAAVFQAVHAGFHEIPDTQVRMQRGRECERIFSDVGDAKPHLEARPSDRRDELDAEVVRP